MIRKLRHYYFKDFQGGIFFLVLKKIVVCFKGNKTCEELAIDEKFVDWQNVPTLKAQLGPSSHRFNFPFLANEQITEDTFQKWLGLLKEKMLHTEF